MGGAVAGLRGLGLDWEVEHCARLLRPLLHSGLRGEEVGLRHHRGHGVNVPGQFLSQEITFNQLNLSQDDWMPNLRSQLQLMHGRFEMREFGQHGCIFLESSISNIKVSQSLLFLI